MLSLLETAKWAEENGFEELELGPSAPLDESVLEQASLHIKLGAIIYCRNPLLPGLEGADFKEQTLKRIRLAGKLGIPKVITSTGIDRGYEWDEAFDFHDGIRKLPIRSMDPVVSLMNEYLEASESCGTKICLETCPIMGNIAISPYLLSLIFDKVPNKRLGLCYDPSHLVWEMMDPYRPILTFKDRLYHVHGKDAEIDRKRLDEVGILSDFSWWRYRVPGLGEISWVKMVSNLYEADYDGVISIEHEDPVWEGSVCKVKKGILIGKRTIEKAIHPEKP
jgi:sugar phosphate isomerase/epimerase